MNEQEPDFSNFRFGDDVNQLADEQVNSEERGIPRSRTRVIARNISDFIDSDLNEFLVFGSVATLSFLGANQASHEHPKGPVGFMLAVGSLATLNAIRAFRRM